MTVTEIVQTVVTDRGPATANAPLQVVPMSPLAIIGIRCLRTYLQGVLGLFVVASIAQSAIPIQLASGILGALELALVAALPGAIVALLQNGIELLARLDQQAPGLRA